MKAQIISLNTGVPAQMQWNGKSVISSMLRHPIAGPLIVHRDRIEGNTFAAPHLHGVEHSVLYAFGEKSAMSFLNLLGRSQYLAGTVGESVTLNDLDESKVSVGDLFQFGEVLAQAVLPRIPCGKVNLRMQHAGGQQALKDCGRSGIYFRILKPGKIYKTDQVVRTESAKQPFMIADLYQKMLGEDELNQDDIALARANGAFPEKLLAQWES